MRKQARMRPPSPAARRGLRAGYRTAIAAFAAVLVLAPALPAAAAIYNNPNVNEIGKVGEVGSPQGLSLPLTLLMFIGIPLACFVVAFLLSLKAGSRGQRYRPGRPWQHEPVWFGDTSSLEREPKRAALPGSGGADGRW